MRGRIIINARFLSVPMAGTTRFAIEICRELIRRNIPLTFLAPPKIFHKDIAEEFDVKKAGFLSGILWEQLILPFYLFKKKSILINFTNTAPILFNKNVTAILDIIPLVKPAWVSKKLFFLSKFITPIIAKKSLQIFTLSEYSKNDIVSKLDIAPEKVKVVYCGVKPLAEKVNKDLKIEPIRGKYILAVSSLEPRKNFINVVKAFNLLNSSELFLVLVGPNFKYQFKTLLPFINKEKTIVKGYVSDDELQILYKNAVAFVYPSLYEGFGLPPLEAMQYGCPVITSNLTSIPEICGNAVLYADPYSPQDIAEKINLLETDIVLRNDLIQKGFEKVKEYTWERTTDLLLDSISKPGCN